MPVYDWVNNGWTFTGTGTIVLTDEDRWTTSATTNTWTTSAITAQWSSITTTITHDYYSDNDLRWWPMITQEDNPRQQQRREVRVAIGAVHQREVARTTARDRADELLCSMLSAEQRESYRLTGEFIVIGSAGGVYRVSRGTAGNIVWLQPDGSVGGRLCAHPDMAQGWLPDQDVALAQLLALSTDEAGFIAKANVHAGSRPRVGALVL